MSNTVDNWQTIARLCPEPRPEPVEGLVEGLVEGPVEGVHNPERVKWWQAVFDGDTCPVTSIVPRWGDFPGIGTAQFYTLDMRAISAEQKQKLILSIADKFKLTVEEVTADLDKVGVPILAADVVVSSSDFGHIASIVL